MNYELIESKRDGGWAVEAINHEGEGEISRVLFMGLNAEALAHEYAAWKNVETACPACLTHEAPVRFDHNGLPMTRCPHCRIELGVPPATDATNGK